MPARRMQTSGEAVSTDCTTPAVNRTAKGRLQAMGLRANLFGDAHPQLRAPSPNCRPCAGLLAPPEAKISIFLLYIKLNLKNF
ncbi:hypothetical protein C8N32_105102 [Rhodovulum imhoffii]|uniref:Uncharacterized protein n=1 Tax=Rhodovulum imhoffii TaxID=365340 RepID=A0A2T5BTH6_9RHOB|nr:hypothetical protein C8N32_105102 [Rhodovulum imhoffii]